MKSRKRLGKEDSKEVKSFEAGQNDVGKTDGEEVGGFWEDSEVFGSEGLKPSKKEVLKTSTLAKFLPNAVTITAMCFGLSSIRFAQCNEWEYAVLCILVSALLDMFDGKIARFLDQSTAFGLELDSLSDMVCFGVAPSVVLYLASMQQLGRIGWGICIFYTVCCALRLARFNVVHSCGKELSELDRKYFTGIPAPAGALMALFPLILFFETDSLVIVQPFYVAFFLVFSGCLMISTIKTFSSKIVEINNTNSWIALTIIAFVIICLTTRLWLSLSLLVSSYMLLIPCGVYEYSKALEKDSEKISKFDKTVFEEAAVSEEEAEETTESSKPVWTKKASVPASKRLSGTRKRSSSRKAASGKVSETAKE
ncbi:MAG: phosphatidylcholine/phosphatidylserine synthase [Alphaproteobacteria bacterium]|nr:phosphatidylcholine/phosphatidylserine synthase [Alphaproteobacteria bacterium]